MNDKLPVNIENYELPVDQFKRLDNDNSNSYGYVNILYLLSIIITLGSVLTVIFLGNR